MASFCISGMNHEPVETGQALSLDHTQAIHAQALQEAATIIAQQQAAGIVWPKIDPSASVRKDDHVHHPPYGGGRGRGGYGGRGRGGASAHKVQAKAQVVEDDDKETDQWVQCSKCQLWRLVPDEFWPDISAADDDEDWTCKDALWPVAEYEPYNPPCC